MLSNSAHQGYDAGSGARRQHLTYTDGYDTGTMREGSVGVSQGHAMPGQHHPRVSSVLPTTQAQKEVVQTSADATGRYSHPDNRTGIHATAGLSDPGADLCSFDHSWEQLLAQLRGASDLAPERPTPPVVGVQPQDRVLLSQNNRPRDKEVGAVNYVWVVNTEDWIDVEYVLRKMLKCQNTDCHAFYSMGYVFFRSCALAHVSNPSDYLKAGVRYCFPESEIVVEIVQAAPEGVLEVACFVEYTP
jgi:hypothetical protein